MSREITVMNPRTGTDDYVISPPNAVAIAKKAQHMRAKNTIWRGLSFEARGKHILALANAIETDVAKISHALEIDTGRRAIANMEVQGVISSLRGWAHLAPTLMPDTDWVQGRAKPQFKHQNEYIAYGLVGVISPWNFPLTLSFIDAIPALMAGASVIIKPSEITPRFADSLNAAIQTAGLNEYLGFVQGDGETGATLIDTVDCICFTGSVATGRKVALRAAQNLIPAHLELGGKDPLIITEDADIKTAIDLALRASVLATGQACQSIERIYVPRLHYKSFTDGLARKAKAVTLNYPEISKGHLGPFIFGKQADIVLKQIDDAVKSGARILSGGQILTHGGGRWLEPTVLINVTHDMLIMREETFGPVMPVMAYDNIDEAIALANDTEFGLSAAVFAKDIDAARTIATRIDAGAVSLQDGALTGQYFEAGKQSFKNSGLGASRMGVNGFLRFFRQKAYIANTKTVLTLDAFGAG